jgi:hypothetical protein
MGVLHKAYRLFGLTLFGEALSIDLNFATVVAALLPLGALLAIY